MFRKEKGQVLVLFAAGIIVLMAVVALAIDGGNVFSDRRQAQNAADSAAMAAAIRAGDDLTNGNAVNSSAMNNAALNRAADNGYDNASDAADVTIFYPPESAPYSGNANYVEVEIISRVPTFFASVIGFDILTNRVRSIAHFVPGEAGRTYEGSSIVALRPAGGCPTGGIFVQGTPEIVLTNGGLFSNNSDSCAFVSNQCDNITLINSGIELVGGSKVDKSCGLAFGSAPQRQFPPEYQPPDHTCTGAGVYDDVANTLSPGTYKDFPPKEVDTKNKSLVTTLLAGTYCITGSIDLNSQGSFTVDLTKTQYERGVYFYLAPTVNGFTFNGGSGLNLSPTYLGTNEKGQEVYTPLIYLDPGPSPYAGKAEACNITGGNETTLVGQIYAPYCDITVNGNSSTAANGQLGSQVIGYTVKLTGGGYLNILYNDFYAGDISKDPFVEQVR